MEYQWQTKTISNIFEKLRCGKRGLSEQEAKRRLQKYGLNKLSQAKRETVALIFLRQFKSPLIYILLAASFVVFLMREIIDGLIILFVLFFNAFVGTIQEGKAQNILLALKKFVETKATVLRDDKEFIIADSEVVPGDILILQEGERVAADARIIISNNLKIDEATLTGESKPVHKKATVLKKIDAPPAEQINMVFKGTYVVSGNGKAIAVATGTKTVIGKISKEIATIDTEIPLKKNIRILSRFIIIAVASINVFLFLLGVAFGKSLKEMFTTIVSLSVSIIPEGLPIVMTLILAAGVRRMSKRNALVKRLQAVETLGQARIIAVDKTGTITKNELVIRQVYLDGKFFNISGVGYEPKGEITLDKNKIDPFKYPELILAGRVAALCAKAKVIFSPESNKWQISGDPTEGALLVFAKKLGLHRDDLEQKFPAVAEIPFDYKNKYQAMVYRFGKERLLTVVGAPEIILNLCERVWRKGKSYLLIKEEKETLQSIFIKMSGQGLRLVAFAFKYGAPETINPKTISALTFGGFFAMQDALRPEVEKAIERALAAGIRVVMISGDHKATAQAIAQQAKIYQPGDFILTGEDLDKLSDEKLAQKLNKISVFARVTPEHKLRIIKAYRARGEIVAMTGDGVNDAPSLVAADLGVAMGQIGTEVAKEASDIVLLDDNFNSIVSAIEEGRNIYKTIKKVILYLFSTSLGEVLTITGALLLGYPLPLLAAQIIWLNLVTDSFLDMALAMEPKEPGLLKKSFGSSQKHLVDSLMAWRMLLMALPMMVGTLFLFRQYFEIDPKKAWTISLTTLAVFQWFNVWNCRHESKSIFQINFFSNKFLIAAFIIIVLLQISAVYNPVMQEILHTTTLTFFEWIMILMVAVSIIFVEETRKVFARRLFL